jgi:methionyl-tRNA formyltransferase
MNVAEPTYVLATNRGWALSAFAAHRARLPGIWRIASSPSDLVAACETTPAPQAVFLPHWSWKIPAKIYSRMDCIVFHMTDLPFGRGGSPLQNLILRGHAQTRLTALRAGEEMDAGPVYLKEDLSLSGSAQEIYERAADLSMRMIARILEEKREPTEQSGPVTVFKRRTPEESVLPRSGSLHELYDFVRMLDAAGYPNAFAEIGDFRIEFKDAHLETDALKASATFRRRVP